MPVPTPALGLVVHYGFVWTLPRAKPPPDAGKDRPCLIVALEKVATPGQKGRVVTRVTYLPISHVPPRGNEQALPLPNRVAVHLGLSSIVSYLYVSYAVEDDWPFDLAHCPGSTTRYDYGFIPPKFFDRVAESFRTRRFNQPAIVHKRS